MKIKTVFSIPLLLLFFICSCSGKPKIEFAELKYNFGDVKQNSEIKHVFMFKNTGGSTLVIEKIKAG